MLCPASQLRDLANRGSTYDGSPGEQVIGGGEDRNVPLSLLRGVCDGWSVSALCQIEMTHWGRTKIQGS